MSKAFVAILICWSTLAALCQSAPKYQVGTITAVKPHPEGEGNEARSDPTSYDVSLQIDDTVYVVLYKPPLSTNTVKYAGGRSILVLVGENTITYNDMLGRSLEVPILSRTPARASKQSK